MIIVLNGPLGIGKSTLAEERGVLYGRDDRALGEPFDVSAPPEELVARMLRLLQVD